MVVKHHFSPPEHVSVASGQTRPLQSLHAQTGSSHALNARASSVEPIRCEGRGGKNAMRPGTASAPGTGLKLRATIGIQTMACRLDELMADKWFSIRQVCCCCCCCCCCCAEPRPERKSSSPETLMKWSNSLHPISPLPPPLKPPSRGANSAGSCCSHCKRHFKEMSFFKTSSSSSSSRSIRAS